MKNYLILLVLLILSINSKAQTTVVTTFLSDTILNNLDSSLAQFQNIAGFDEFSSVNLIRIDSLGSSVDTLGRLLIDIPNDNCSTLAFNLIKSEYINEHNYTYYGRFENPDTSICSCKEGEVFLASEGDRKYGSLKIDDDFYEILSVGNNYSALCRIDTTSFNAKQGCYLAASEREAKPSQQKNINLRTDKCEIRVLFLYTPNAEAKYGLNNLTDKAKAAIQLTNDAFGNSEIYNNVVRFANIRKLEGFAEHKNSILTDIHDLENNTQVLTWREDDLADVVCLITNIGYPGATGAAPSINEGNPQKEEAYLISEAESLNDGSYTFSHELGHVLGCRHQLCTNVPSDCDSDGTYEHGYYWEEHYGFLCLRIRRKADIMNTGSIGAKILNYSNPDVNYGNHVTGNSRSNTAEWIRSSNGCYVSEYYSEPTYPINISIDGDEILCRPLSGEYIASVSGNSPFSYQWQVSTNGFDYGGILSTNQTVWLNSQNYTVSVIYLRVRVQDINGVFKYAFFTIHIYQKGTNGCNFHPLILNSNNEIISNIYPNPFTNEVNIEFEVERPNTPVKIELYNSIGVKIQEINGIYSKGKNSEKISKINIEKGILLLNIILDGKLKSYKLLKIE